MSAFGNYEIVDHDVVIDTANQSDQWENRQVFAPAGKKILSGFVEGKHYPSAPNATGHPNYVHWVSADGDSFFVRPERDTYNNGAFVRVRLVCAEMGC